MPPRGQFAEVHRQVHAAVGQVDDLLPGQNVEVNGGVLGDKVADARQQQALHQRGVRIEGQRPRQLAILDVQNFLVQRVEGAVQRPLHALALRRQGNSAMKALE